jgi:hypothetical protein
MRTQGATQGKTQGLLRELAYDVRVVVFVHGLR